MKRLALALAAALLIAGLGAAYGQFGGGQTGIPGSGPQVGPIGGPQVPGQGPMIPSAGAGGGGGGTTGFILMIDNTSRILQTDNASKICRAGGC